MKIFFKTIISFLKRSLFLVAFFSACLLYIENLKDTGDYGEALAVQKRYDTLFFLVSVFCFFYVIFTFKKEYKKIEKIEEEKEIELKEKLEEEREEKEFLQRREERRREEQRIERQRREEIEEREERKNKILEDLKNM